MEHKQLKDIQEGKIAAVYLVYGTEYYFMEQVKTAFNNRAEDEEAVTTYDLRETAIQDVILDAETFPFFSDHQFIFAENPSFLDTKNDKIFVTHETEALEQYLEQPVSYTTLVLIAPYEKLDGRKKITKQLKKQAETIECQPLQGKALHGFVKQMAKTEGVQLEEETYEKLGNTFQTDLYGLQKELNKLALYAGEKEVISKQEADLVISPTNQTNALQFVDAVIQKDLSKAIGMFKDLEKMKEEPIGLIALLAYQFRVLFQVKLYMKKGYNMDKMKAVLKVHPYVTQLAVQRSKYFTEASLSKIMQLLAETDEKIKRGKRDKSIAFEMLLYQLIRSY